MPMYFAAAPVQPTGYYMAPVVSVSFTVDAPSEVTLSGHIDFNHTGAHGTSSKAIMVAIEAHLDDVKIPGSVTGTNILNRTDHYAVLPIHGYSVVEPGTHTVKILARSASSAAPKASGLACVKKYNGLFVRVDSL